MYPVRVNIVALFAEDKSKRPEQIIKMKKMVKN